MKKYGSVCVLQNEKVKEKSKKTCLQKYGVEIPQRSNIVKDKTAETCYAKFGTKAPAQNNEVKNKIRSTWKIRDPEFKERNKKSVETNLKKYGFEYQQQSEIGKLQRQETNLIKYGSKYTFAKDSSLRKIFDEHRRNKTAEELLEIKQKASFKYLYEDLCFDSSWELALWVYAKDHEEEIEKSPCIFEYVYKNRIHKYIPDFKYKGLLLELKGDMFFENEKMINPFDRNQDDFYEAKHQCMLYNGVIIWRQKEIKFALDYIKDRYGKNYLKQFKQK